MNQFPEKDLLGYVVGALDAQDQRNLQAAIDADPQLEEQLLAIKNVLTPLEYLDFHGSRPGLARRTCELVANIGQPPIRRLDLSKLESMDPAETNQHAAVYSVLSETLRLQSNAVESDSVPSAALYATGVVEPISNTPMVTGVSSLAGRVSSRFFTPAQPNEAGRSFWRHSQFFSSVDIAVTAGVLMVLAGLLFPAIAYTRHQSRLTHCQNNLRQLGSKLFAYSELNQGRFVEIPQFGKLAVAGIVGPMLKEKGLLEDDSLLSCAGVAASSKEAPVRIPTISSIQDAVGERLLWLQRSMSGHYGYSLGYQTSEGYHPPTNLARSNVVLMSDSPSVGPTSRVSSNHGGKGQNCLFEDGSVQYLPGETFGAESIFLNHYNLVAPGCGPDDNVIAPSHISLLFSLTQ